LQKSSGEYKIAKTEEGHIRIIKLLDLIVGIPCVILDDSKGAVIRRSEYGRAGCFRPTPYGIEYRTPSCWWIKSPITVSLILGLARLSWSIAGYSVGENMDEKLFELIKYTPEDIKGICDESNKKEAVKVWNVLKNYVALMNRAPMYIRNVRLSNSAYLHKFNVINGGLPIFTDGHGKLIGEKRLSTFKPVFLLAAFEYLIKNGLNSVISNNIRKEWSIGKAFNNQYGFSNGLYKRLSVNKDFAIFQNSLLKEIF